MSRRRYTFARALRDADRAARAHARAEAQVARLQAKQDVEDCLQQAAKINLDLSKELEDFSNVMEYNMRIPYSSVLYEAPKLEPVKLDAPAVSLVKPTLIGVTSAWLILSILFSVAPDPGRGILVFICVSIVGVIVYYIGNLKRRRTMEAYLADVEQRRAEAQERHDAETLEFQNFVADYRAGKHEATEDYFHTSIAQIKLPFDSTYSWHVTYNESSRELIVQYELPESSIVPEVASVKFVKTRHEFDKKMRKQSELGRIYTILIQSLALTVLRHLFKADIDDKLDTVTLNCFVKTTNKATGKNVEPCLITVRASKKDFEQIDLHRVEKAACLKGLGARITSNAYEMQPIK